MGEVVNLRLVRKRAERDKRERAAASNRVAHGRRKADKERTKAEAERASAVLDGHRLGDPTRDHTD